MNDIKFSIIVPVYNMKEAFLRASLNSLLNLKYNNYEVIIVDDGSNAETKNILEEYSNNKLVKLLHQKNSGQHIARINGINNANGEYVIFVDSDDIYGENGLITKHGDIDDIVEKIKILIENKEYRNKLVEK